MGSGESTTRKVSFGVDDEDRVRILRGVKLSEDVLQRMRGVANIAPERTPSSTSSPQKDTGASHSSNSSPRPQQSPQSRAQPSNQSSSSKPASYAKEEQRRFERQQTILKEELAKVAQREKEEMTKAKVRERQHLRQEAQNTKKMSADEIEAMAQQLQKKDAQLKALDAFYKEQLAQLEKRNLERYEQSKEEFHQAASKTEANVRSRNTDPVCSGLQAQILSCYRENRDQTLRCSDLAKEYMQCINAAKKNLLVNHG
ncbi:MICOS complex subunit mic25a isoform X1 [Epinephelus fuscoguttatus]|uniref:MICOS complex subunit mic25a isoform X1 n=1 Tax=Epinephelus fuscoguttatus TaxID=293821 RepID=UPI0020D0B1A9|nr:MICOS complex subunit mic25a isoform X1 [Epinephelus fuscoguttatus]